MVDERLYSELWVSLGSLIRSYTAAHGLHINRYAVVETCEERIMVRHEARWLRLEREGPMVTWTRENSSNGKMEITEAGRLRDGIGEAEMDMAAEAWARELMQ